MRQKLQNIIMSILMKSIFVKKGLFFKKGFWAAKLYQIEVINLTKIHI